MRLNLDDFDVQWAKLVIAMNEGYETTWGQLLENRDIVDDGTRFKSSCNYYIWKESDSKEFKP